MLGAFVALDYGNNRFHNRLMIHPASISNAPARGRGRPREFDIDEALAKAILVFRERGYHATSIADLTAAMGLAAGSVYKAFKDKRSIFLAAFDRYQTVRHRDRLELVSTGKSGRGRLEDLLTYYVEASHGLEGQRGCLVVGCAVELSTFDEEVASRVAAALGRNETLIGELIRAGQVDGSIPAHIDAEATARLMLCVIQGLRVVGKTGRTRAELAAVLPVLLKTLD